MALMYPWATKEYLLWEMTIGQIILYHNEGLAMRGIKTENKSPQGFADMSEDEVRKIRDDYKAQYGDI